MTEQMPGEAPGSSDGGRRGGRRAALIGGIAAIVLVGGGVGAYAVYDRLSGGGAQPHDVLPASTQVYVRVDLDPSASQKVDLFRLLRKVPDLADEIGVKSEGTDIRRLVFPELLASECDDVDYAKDVEPWIGDRIGVGANIEDRSFLVAVQTTDEDESRAGIKQLFGCADEEYGLAYLDGYAIIAPKQALADQAVKATEKGSLGDSKEFTADVDQLGDQGIASAWADLKALATLPEVQDGLGGNLDELAEAGTVATALRADGDAIELAVLGAPAGDLEAEDTDLAELPADTVAALSIAGVGDQIGAGFESFVQELDGQLSGFMGGTDDDFGGGFGVQGLLDSIEQQTGFRLPEDLETLFGDRITFAIGSKNLETLPNLSGPEGFADIDVALALTSEQAPALDLAQRIATLAVEAGLPLVASPTDDGAVLATNQDAADALAEPNSSLGGKKAFTSVVPDGESAAGGLFVDIGTIVDTLLEADPPQDVRAGLESASALSAFGISATQQDDDRSLVRFRLAFK